MEWIARGIGVPRICGAYEADREGRQNTINAFVVYLAVTAFVLWLDWQGRLG